METEMTQQKRMTPKDRDALLKHQQDRERVLKTTAKRRSADMLAQFEVELQHRHEIQDNEVFSRVTEVLGVAIGKAMDEVNKECERLHIPSRFRPRIRSGWSPGGLMNVDRKLMLAIAEKQAKAQEMRAYEVIEQEILDTKTKILAASFDTDIALEMLSSMPPLEALIPPLSFATIEQLFLRDPQRMIDEYNKSHAVSPYSHRERITAKDVYALPDHTAKQVDPDADHAMPPKAVREASPWVAMEACQAERERLEDEDADEE
jgi:hypothetical protein